MILNRYRLKITGRDPKRLLKTLNKKKINLHKISLTDKCLIIDVSYQDYQKIKEIKTVLYKIEVIETFGLKRIESFILKYKIFIISIIIGSLLFLVLINMIFDIEIVTNDSKIKKLIVEELNTHGISKYKFVKSYKEIDKIKTDILKNNRDKLEWLEIERVGTKYIIKIEARKIKDLDTDNTPRDLVAKKNGIILELKVESGEVLKKVNDYVQKGDVIVSGKIMKDEEIKQLVKSKGRIYAETWYNIKVEEPVYYKEEHKTGRSNYVLELNFFDRFVKLFDFANYKSSKKTDILSISNPFLPIFFSIRKQEEVEITEEVNTVSNAIFLASLKAKDKLLETLGESDEILMQKSLKIIEEDSKIIVEVFFKVKEDITDYININQEDLENEQNVEW